jgi:carboxyl-terminal processing protease
MPQRNFLLLILAIAVSCACFAQGQQGPFGRYLAQGLATIDRSALEPAPNDELFAGAMDGMVGVLREHGDQHSQFFDEAEARRLRNEIHQQVGGIGVRIRVAGDPPRPIIRGPIKPESPAGRGGLQPGDQILKIDGAGTDGLRHDDVVERLDGSPGTTIRLSIERPGEPNVRPLEIVRELIPIEAVLGDRRDEAGNWQFALEGDPRIAHVRIVSFGDRTAEQFAAVMEQLVGDGVQAVILDLRDNVGGGLASAVAVSEMFLPAGKTIVETRGRDDALRQQYATKTDGKYRALPIAVIVNQQSASASEIVAASLQDHGRAVVVGQRSFGKGTVQQMLPLGKSLLKLTWAGFRRPSGANIHRGGNAPQSETWGVTPDEGLECVLSPAEYSAYRAYRSQRDEADGAGGHPADAFVDEPLRLARLYLQEWFVTKP